MRKEERKKLMMLVDTSIDVEARLRKMKYTRADAMDLFNDPEVQQEWLDMCRGRILLVALPDLLNRLKDDAISGKDGTRVGSQKLFLQAINALKVEEHKHLHVNNYSDDRLQSEIDRTVEEMRELQKEAFPQKAERPLEIEEAEFQEDEQ